MPDSLHLLIPCAALSGGGARRAGVRDVSTWPRLPNLQALLARMVEGRAIAVDEDSPADPFEIALARAQGLPDAPGRTPWAAWETQTTGATCAWLAPVHLQAGMNDVRLADPAQTPVSQAHAQALMQSCAPLLAGDGIALRAARSDVFRADAWLAQGALLDGLTCWSPRRAAGRSLMPDQLLRADDAARQGQLARLTSELQMLLHAHPVNEAREREGRDALNALWLYGAGRWTRPVVPAPDAADAPDVTVAWDLCSPDRQPQDRAEAWRALDAGLLAQWLARACDRARGARAVRLTLCGPRRARTWVTPPRASWRAAMRHWLRPVSVAAVLETL